MKKFISLIVFILAPFLLFTEGISLVVTRVEPIGVEAETARLVEELLHTELSQIPLFQLVERDKLDTLLQEQELQLSGITSAESAARAGNILNVQKVIFGSLGRYDTEYVKYILSLRLVDVERAVVEAAESVEIRSKEDIRPAITEISRRLSERVEITGKIFRIEEHVLYTTLGESAGVTPDQALSVVKVDLIRDGKGHIMMREETPVANLVVEKVSPEGSRCRVLEAAGNLETGMTVRRGRLELESIETAASLEVKSIPENARVYLGDKFLGVTPLKLSGLEPGRYRIEIKSGAGYRTYVGKITLRTGRSVVLERELEQEVEIEDLLRIGKMPRKRTDPKTALKKALIPGLGAYYNGYESQLPGIAFMLFGTSGAALAGVLNATRTDTQSDWGNAIPSLKCNDWLMAGLYAGTGLMIYGGSLVDAWVSAKEDFLYPTYMEYTVCGTGIFTHLSQTTDTHGVDPDILGRLMGGVSSWRASGGGELIYEGRRYFFSFGMRFPLMDFTYVYRPVVTERLLFGLGMEGTMNLGELSHDDIEELTVPFFRSLYAPVFSLAYRTTRLELDLFASPAAIVGLYQYKPLAGGGADLEYIQPLVIPAIIARVSANYFLTLKFGLRVSVRYGLLWNRGEAYEGLTEAGYSTVDKAQFLDISGGIVFRL